MGSITKIRRKGNKTYTYSGRGKRTTTTTHKAKRGKSGTTISSSWGTDGKSWKTVTTKFGDGSFRRDRIGYHNSLPKKRSRSSGGTNPLGILIAVIIVIGVTLYNYFAG